MEKPNHCPRCQHEAIIGYGSVKGKRRWQCKHCEYRFTRLTPKGKPPGLKAFAVALYGFGLSFNAIGTLFSVTGEAVRQWVKKFSGTLPPLEADPKDVRVVEMDEMWHFLQKKTTNTGSGRPLLILAGNWSDCEQVNVIQLR